MGGDFILRVLCIIFAILGLYIWAEPPILVVSQLPPFPNNVEIVATPGVSSFDVSIARRAVCLTAKLLEEKYSLALGRDVKIILVPDVFSYSLTLQNDENLSSDVALLQASNSFGTANNNHIIINVGGIAGYNDTLFITAHELTHQYQIAEAGQWSRLNWLMEGMADMVAAEVVNDNTVNSGANEVDLYRFSWLNTLRRAHGMPNLKKLDTRYDWVANFEHDGPVTYRTAGFAVLKLATSRDTANFKTYMNTLKSGVDAEQAFQSAFGVSCSAYAQEYEDWLAKNL